MRITFNRIEIHNFKSFADEIFDFETKNGLNLICGKNLDNNGWKNGCGKTNLINALVFSLFGQTQNNSKNCNIANKWLTDKEVRVVTYFTVNKKQYKIVSGFNKHNNQYCELSEIADNGEINLTKSTMSETRNLVEKEILHCDKSIFMRTVLLSSDQNYNFFMLHKNEKKDFIEKLFDISVFGEMYDKIHHDINQLDKKMILKQNNLLSLNKNKDEYQFRLSKFEKDKQIQIKQFKDDLKTIDEKLTQFRNIHVKSNEEVVKKCELMIEKANDIYRKINDKQREKISELQNIKNNLTQLKTDKQTKQKAIEKHSKLLNKLCNDCLPIVKKYYNINDFDNEISIIDEKIKKLSENIEKTEKEEKYYEKKLFECNNKIAQIQCKIKDLTSEQIKVNTQIIKLEGQQSNIENNIANIESIKNPYSELFDNNSIEIQKETTELKNLENKYKYLKFAENIVSQETLRKFIIQDMIGLLNNKIKTYLTKFGAKYSVIFDSDMNYKLIDENNEFEYGDFSGGERARLMIAVCFAFRDFMYVRNNFSSNILFLDEFIDGAIDSSAIESILQILSEYSKQYEQNVFIISHRKSEIDNTMFNNIIQIVKKDHISNINYLE